MSVINDQYLNQNELLTQENTNLKRRLQLVQYESEVKKAKVVTLSKPFVDLTNDEEDSDIEVIEGVPEKISRVEVSSGDSDVEETPVASKAEDGKPPIPSEDWKSLVDLSTSTDLPPFQAWFCHFIIETVTYIFICFCELSSRFSAIRSPQQIVNK